MGLAAAYEEVPLISRLVLNNPEDDYNCGDAAETGYDTNQFLPPPE